MIVVDSNVICYYCIPGAKTALADCLRAQHAQWCVPPLWRSEFRNVVLGQVQRGAMGLSFAHELLDLAEAMLRETEFAVDSRAILSRAMESGCTAYDCEYVVLAEDLGVQLVTSDKQVLRAFPHRAVALEDYVEQ
ncbi:MAG TPA: type II toxin-antitoxin system VapC family toxin [Anaeromyxobacteraceae bacterium]|nr:type II toxin-antitoxin system VapC family toxin [Anaeromyxobacteraceae bacterium]